MDRQTRQKGTRDLNDIKSTTGTGNRGDTPKRKPTKAGSNSGGRREANRAGDKKHIEKAKYKLYMGQLSTEDSNLDTDMDKSHYQFLD